MRYPGSASRARRPSTGSVPARSSDGRNACGRHRLEAARKLKWPCIRAEIRDGMEADAAELAEIDENLRVHASNRSDRRTRPTITRLGLEAGAYLSADEALKLLDLASCSTSDL